MNPLPFAKPSAIPIIGQPFVLKGGFATIFGQCGCEGKGLVVLVGMTPNACPECKRAFIVQSLAIDAAGQLQVQVGVLQQAPLASA